MTRAQIERRRRKRKNKRLLCCIMAVVIFTSFAVHIRQKQFKVSHYVIREIKSGDTLWSVARDTYGDSVDIRRMIHQITDINGIEGGRIYPGQALSLPISK